MSCTHNDIILEILSRLGVKDLLRFRCVSKPWCSLIHHPYFIKLHLSHSLKTNTNRSLIFLQDHIFFSVNFDSLETVQKLNQPPDVSDEGKVVEILGSCNGLVALLNDQKDISLWNPSTRKSQMLPFTKLKFPPLFYEYYGLGYDLISDDYKLVRMLQFYIEDDDSFKSELEVYSLRTNSCRKIKDSPFRLTRRRAHGVLANNAVHWLVSKNPKSDTQSVVVAFNLDSEEFRVIELPDCLPKGSKARAMGGYLCLIATYWKVEWVADVWIMKEYGVKESWTKLLSLKSFDPIEVLPLAFSKNGDKVLLSIWSSYTYKFVWYTMNSKTFEVVSIECVRNIDHMHMLVRSLVPPNGNDAMLEQEGKKFPLKFNVVIVYF